MRKSIAIAILLFTAVVGFRVTTATADNGRTLVVQLQGRDTGETRTIPPVANSGTKEGNCFDMNLFDVVANKAIGTATRCFADINTAGAGMALTDTIFFRFPEGNMISRNRTTIQPAIDSSPEVTHIAVAIPDSYTATLLPDAGSGSFKGVLGSARLAGAMDMSQFRARNEIAFNDIIVIELVGRELAADREPADRDERIRRAQQQLQVAGFYTGTIDGMLGPQSRTALRDYQARHGLPATGRLDMATRKALAVE
jgi:hypothetical protein